MFLREVFVDAKEFYFLKLEKVFSFPNVFYLLQRPRAQKPGSPDCTGKLVDLIKSESRVSVIWCVPTRTFNAINYS